jgi:hypothetical protein
VALSTVDFLINLPLFNIFFPALFQVRQTLERALASPCRRGLCSVPPGGGDKRIGKQPNKRHLRTKPRAEESKCELIGCQSVRQWSSFLSLRTGVHA